MQQILEFHEQKITFLTLRLILYVIF